MGRMSRRSVLTAAAAGVAGLAGVLRRPLDHDEVLATARRVRGRFISLLQAVIGRIHR